MFARLSGDGRPASPAPVPSFSKAAAKLAPSIGIAAALLVLMAVFALKTVPALRIRDGEGKTLALLPLSDGRFVHRYVHSIHLSPVDEFFEVERGLIKLYELRYDTMSVGMPSDEEHGYRIENGRFVLSMDREFAELPIRVSVVPGHGIVAGGTFRDFRDWAPPMKPLVLSGGKLIVFRWRR